MQTTKYGWEALDKQGDWLIVPDKVPAQLSSAVRSYLLRRFGRGVVVTLVGIPAGTFVALAWAPSEEEKMWHQETRKSPDFTLPEVEEDPDEDIRQYLDE